MARSDLTVTEITRSGVDPSLSAANVDGHAVENNGRMFIDVNNGGGAPITVTVQTPRTVDGLAVAELQVSVTNGVRRLIGPFPKATFDQPGADAGKVYVDFSAVTSVTVGAFKV